MSRAQFTVAISTDKEAAASKRMVIYAFSAQINLFTSFFLKQPLRNTVFILFPLGIYLDEHLQWDPQIKHVNNKLAKNVGIINKLRNYLDFHVLKQLYYTLIYPYLNYGLASWGTAYKTRLNKICIKQNRCIRSMFFAHGREHIDSYYNLLGILKFEISID